MNEKEKRWVEMGMLVGKRWGALDGSNYKWKKKKKKETNFSQHMQIEIFFFFFWEEENKKSKNLWVIPGNVAHCSKFVTHFF